jgi:hypothetical protein
MSRPDAIGPWATGISDAERLARLRSLRALVGIFTGARHPHPLVDALRRAESGDPAAMQEAWELLERVPARSRRNVWCSFAELLKAPPPVKERKIG